MEFLKFRILSKICLIFILICPIFVHSVSLDNTGSYKLVVAIDEKTAQNSISEYVDNIKISVQQLSEVLYISTNSKFSIEEVDILIPSHWSTSFDSLATKHQYDAADIKISHVHSLPKVDNPNLCRGGGEGSAILLPYNFFDDPNNSSYGHIGKALLTQFVRFRYGAWEEHGHNPGDYVFPYFWKNGNQWEVNACTNKPILGEFKNIEDDTDCSPTTGDEYPPISQCRFFPASQQTATSSLMSYHFLPNIEKFCDSQTHNKKVPTPQNLFCTYKSITEVIEASSDWKGTTEPNNPAPAVVFKVVKNIVTSTPLLYILLDSGISQAPSLVMTEISAALKTLVEDSSLGDLVATVGKYPGDDAGQLITEIVPWTPFREGREQFIRAFNTTFGKRPGFRDFGGALSEAVRLVADRDHPSGAIILMVKTGIETNTGLLTPESSVLTQVLLSNVKIFGVEIQGSDVQPGIALANVILKSEGSHLRLNSSSDYSLELAKFMDTLKGAMQNEIRRDYVLALHEVVPLNSSILLYVNSTMRRHESFLFPLSGTIIGTPQFSTTVVGYIPNINLPLMPQWGSTLSTSTKVYYNTGAIAANQQTGWDEGLKYTCAEEDCIVMVHIFVQVADLNVIPPVTLRVSTSAENNLVDMVVENSVSDLGTPFAIYAKLEHDSSIPLAWTPGLDVFAYIFNPDNSEIYQIELKDDGRAVPDVAMNDGIFSGSWVPTHNGPHNIWVYAKYVPQNGTLSEFQSSSASSSVGKLFPVDQIHMGCGSNYFGCYYEVPSIEFVTSQTLPKSVEFKNVESYIPMAHRIVDFFVTPMSGLEIKLEWTDPGVLIANDFVKIDSYQIKHSDDFDKLLEDFGNAEDLFPNPGDLPVPGEPGSQQSVTYTFTRETYRYFAIKSISSLSGPNSPSPIISKIVGASIRNIVSPTTTTTTTTMIPPTTSSTPAPTKETTGTGPTSTTEQVTVTDISPTPSRTTPPPTTTLKTTQPPTTTRKPDPSPFPSTTQPPSKHWFEKKEGLITIGVFGAGMIILLALGIFVIVKFKK